VAWSGRADFKSSFPVICQFIAQQHKHRPEELDKEYATWAGNGMQFPWWMASYLVSCKKMAHKFTQDLSWPCYRWNHPAGFGCKNQTERVSDLPGCRSVSGTHYHHYCAICGFRSHDNPEPMHVKHGAFTGGDSYSCPMQKRYLEEITRFPFSEDDILEIVSGYQKSKYGKCSSREFSYKQGLFQPREYHDYWSHHAPREEDRIGRVKEEEQSRQLSSWLSSIPGRK